MTKPSFYGGQSSKGKTTMIRDSYIAIYECQHSDHKGRWYIETRYALSHTCAFAPHFPTPEHAREYARQQDAVAAWVSGREETLRKRSWIDRIRLIFCGNSEGGE